MSRDLLQQVLEELERSQYLYPTDYRLSLIADIRAELEKPDIDDPLTAAFMLGYEAAKNDYWRSNEP